MRRGYALTIRWSSSSAPRAARRAPSTRLTTATSRWHARPWGGSSSSACSSSSSPRPGTSTSRRRSRIDLLWRERPLPTFLEPRSSRTTTPSRSIFCATGASRPTRRCSSSAPTSSRTFCPGATRMESSSTSGWRWPLARATPRRSWRRCGRCWPDRIAWSSSRSRLVPASSRDIRARVARGEAVDGLVPPAVARLIVELGLYAGR